MLKLLEKPFDVASLEKKSEVFPAAYLVIHCYRLASTYLKIRFAGFHLLEEFVEPWSHSEELRSEVGVAKCGLPSPLMCLEYAMNSESVLLLSAKHLR